MLNPDFIRKAILAHAEWKTRLQKGIETGKIDISVTQARSATGCQLGQWLGGAEISVAEKQTEHYTSVKRLHARFHEEASKVVQLVAVGHTGAAAKAMDLLGDYSRASSALTNALSTWQAAIADRGARPVPG